MKNKKGLQEQITDLSNRVNKLEETIKVDPGSLIVAKPKTINEYLRERGLGTGSESLTDLVLALMIYGEQFDAKGSFTTRDVDEAVRTAKMPKLSNTNDVINRIQRKGYFGEDDKSEMGLKSWFVTASGLSYFNQKFEKDVNKDTK